MTLKPASLPPIVIGCDYGLAFDCTLENDDGTTTNDFTGWSVDGDLYELTDAGASAAPIASSVLSWADITAGTAVLTLTDTQTATFNAGRAITRPVLVRPDAVRLPMDALALAVEKELAEP